MPPVTDRQTLNREQREHRAEEELADRLQALSRPLAEKVLGRAIELDAQAQKEAEEAAATIDYDTLKEVALEVGITEDALKRALLEEFDTDKDHNPRRIEKAVAPDAVHGGVIVSGDVEEVRQRLAAAVETLTSMRTTPGMMMSRPGSIARNIQTSVIPQGDATHLVELHVDTGKARRRAWRWVIAIAILSMIFGGNFAPIAVLGAAAFFIGMTVWWVRTMASMARKLVNKVLGAFFRKPDEQVEPGQFFRRTEQAGQWPQEWLDIWERAREQFRQ